MPEEMERKLKAAVAGKKWSEERKNAYIYGTMRKTGWTPSTQKRNPEQTRAAAKIALTRLRSKK